MRSLSIRNYRQALSETASLLSAATLIIVLAAMVAFIAYQGSQYFSVKALYKVSLNFPESRDEVFYEASNLSREELALQFEQRYRGQFLGQPQARPQVDVVLAQEAYALITESGRRYFGEFHSLRAPLDTSADDGISQTQRDSRELALSELNNLQDTLALLEANLKQIQEEHLRTLHARIASLDDSGVALDTPARQDLMLEFNAWQNNALKLKAQIAEYYIEIRQANGEISRVGLSELQAMYQPNQLSFSGSVGLMLSKLWQFVSDEPKQASTTGGVFPAIFGTVLLVLLMAIVVAPVGVIAAIYLHEYAPNNRTTQLIRIGISNMAAVPSVVYGVFGLGFFVYYLGGSLDELFYSQSLPAPTFGTPGLLWASLTMGLLTLPVVIVSAEEGLRRVPAGLRAGSYALGATKFETILKVVVPMASPGMLTGVILAIARAAGEVAPLILVGAVKYAPNLPIDGESPFVHLERQFMHLGVFIYDGAFHNQTQTQSASLMFATCMLLLLIVFLLNIFAIIFRHRLRHKYERL